MGLCLGLFIRCSYVDVVWADDVVSVRAVALADLNFFDAHLAVGCMLLGLTGKIREGLLESTGFYCVGSLCRELATKWTNKKSVEVSKQ